MPDAGHAYQRLLDAAADDQERCLAWIGLAAVKRVTDDLPGALAALEQAETAAARHQLVVQQARIHFLRGNLCFPRGDIEGCFRERAVELELARRASAAELEAMLARRTGSMPEIRSSADHQRTRPLPPLCRGVRSRRVRSHRGGEPADGGFHPLARFQRRQERGSRRCRSRDRGGGKGWASSGREVIGHHAAFFCQHALMDFDRASRHAEAASALAQQLGARRFDAQALVFRAELHRFADRRGQALADAEEAVKVSRETGLAFIGPFTLGALALTTDDPVVRRRALEEGEELLQAGAVGHNHLCFGAMPSMRASARETGRARSGSRLRWRTVRALSLSRSATFTLLVLARSWRIRARAVRLPPRCLPRSLGAALAERTADRPPRGATRN